jgi:hypothetical protein
VQQPTMASNNTMFISDRFDEEWFWVFTSGKEFDDKFDSENYVDGTLMCHKDVQSRSTKIPVT